MFSYMGHFIPLCGQCSARVDMGKDLGIVTVVELTRLCAECVLVCTLYVLGNPLHHIRH